MAVITYPAVYPLKIQQLTFPEYKQVNKKFNTLDIIIKQTGFTGSGATLQLSYSFLNMTDLQTLLAFWALTQGKDSFVLPSSFFNFVPVEYSNLIKQDWIIQNWVIKEAPTVKPRVWGTLDPTASLADLDLSIMAVII